MSKLTSTKTQLPYDYYSLPYCAPKQAHLESENLGELFSGDRIENSVYKVEAKVNKACEVACRRKLSKDQRKAFERAIEDDYQVHWILGWCSCNFLVFFSFFLFWFLFFVLIYVACFVLFDEHIIFIYLFIIPFNL